ncbi:flagellar biosynthesis protein FlhF [Thiohalobacter thiocyanaticus]|uniref:Flagellar biosynthesis protein FlhF n=1 Tax=Thiohalobacter thiocyanaticus TaxID=585455 RepID=A0A426QGP3_9GAMM|nr:flagellar biosynthesis protein FlhF [Thiohalobacter thiocyanaticus]RRQ20900.1 flagellar biosynthesis protein FlhF [Thiohalobacter thiocyanaticus]
MKIKRFFAQDMRQAIRKVRDELGADAVILSNRKLERGIEIIAAIDYDESLVANSAGPAAAAEADAPREAAAEGAGTYDARARYSEAQAGETPAPVAGPAPTRPAVQAGAESRPQARNPLADIEWDHDPAIIEMRREIQEMRGLLENQLAHLAWGELNRRRPAEAAVLRRLSALGLPSNLCAELAEAAGESRDPEQGWRRALGLLAQRLPVTDDDILSQGGIVALVGSTGVGKTTTVAKLAARYALRHGPRSVALVTTDSYRIGAHEQLFTYGRILGVPVQVAADHNELHTTLQSLRDKRLVLIDTAGMSQRDLRLSEQFTTLREAGMPIRSYLVMSATTQAEVLEEAVRAFNQGRLDGCILTKVDEAAGLGGAISVIAGHQLPLAYVGDGQRVPEDLHPARAQNLVNRAISLQQQAGQETHDDTLAERFGALAANGRV